MARYQEAKKVSALLAKVSTAFTAAVLDPKGKTIDVALANEAAEQALTYNFLVAPLVLPLAVPLVEGVAALVAAGVSYCTAQHIMAAYERGDFDVIAHNLMELGHVIMDRLDDGVHYFLKGESYRSPQDVVEAYLRDTMRAAVPFEARGDKAVHAGGVASRDPVHRSSGYGSSAYPGAKADLDGYAGARTGFHTEAEADGFAKGQALNLTPADHGGGSILGTPVHRVGPQIFDTPVYDGKPEPFVTPLPETGPGSLVTPIPGDQLNPLPGFVPADDGLRSGSVLLREGDGEIPPSIKSKIKTAKLPTTGKLRFVPSTDQRLTKPLKKGLNRGYIDRFGNEWVKGSSRTVGEDFEWDVQLSRKGQESIGWASRDGKHVNVSQKGRITHK